MLHVSVFLIKSSSGTDIKCKIKPSPFIQQQQKKKKKQIVRIPKDCSLTDIQTFVNDDPTVRLFIHHKGMPRPETDNCIRD